MIIEIDSKFKIKQVVYKLDISNKELQIKSYTIIGINLFMNTEGAYISYLMQDYGLLIDEEDLYESYELAYAKYMEIRRTII